MPFRLVLAIDCYYFSKFYLLFEEAAVYIYKVKWSRCRPGVAQRVGRGIALLFHDRGTRREWVFISTPRPHFTLGKDPVSILQEAGWAPGPVWMGKKSCPYWDSILDPLTRSQSLYQLSYPSHTHTHTCICIYIYIYICSIYAHTNLTPNCCKMFHVYLLHTTPTCFGHISWPSEGSYNFGLRIQRMR